MSLRLLERYVSVSHGNNNERFHGCKGQVQKDHSTEFSKVVKAAMDLKARYIVKASYQGEKKPGHYYIKVMPGEKYLTNEIQITSEEIVDVLLQERKMGKRKGSTSWVLFYD